MRARSLIHYIAPHINYYWSDWRIILYTTKPTSSQTRQVLWVCFGALGNAVSNYIWLEHTEYIRASIKQQDLVNSIKKFKYLLKWSKLSQFQSRIYLYFIHIQIECQIGPLTPRPWAQNTIDYKSYKHRYSYLIKNTQLKHINRMTCIWILN